MAEFSMKREVARGSVRYRLEGVFTGQAALDLRRTLEAEQGRVELDFSRVQRFFDFGLAAFATELQAAGGERLVVELRGLSTHHRRLLQYFGLDLEGERDRSMNDDLPAEPPSQARAAQV